MSFLDEFHLFLKKYNVVGLAIAVVIGNAATKMVGSIVNDVIMPIVNVLIPGGTWQQAILALGPVNLLIGNFTSSLIEFLIIAFVVFTIVKWIVREDAGKKS